MSKVLGVKPYAKLFFFITLIFSLGLFSCGGDDGTYDGWKYIGDVKGRNGEYVSVYVYLREIHVEENVRKFWVRYYANKNPDTKETYLVQVGYWEVDCIDRDLYVLAEEYYGPDGRLLGKLDKKFKDDYEEGTIGDKLVYAVCRYAGKTY